MTARRMLSLVGTAVGGLIGWSEPPPSADPASLRTLLADLGVRVGDGDEALAEALREFQARVGLRPDGVAGPRTVHVLSRYAKEVRDLRRTLAA
ncbi:peptidoglycan-binding protein [Actinoplanes sp. TBRC 11911]|uniref:peptidoglycan-binding protein n=1 Tax=Actinoplanes sp. TBRC 11911 TaxID=2729386 RepID=UPI00145C7414|nr:peptidoglycan-binding domain-containing protein [Actinoplanes sp. TBRC 11911]NMO56647.1 peptidoglycan-binding protein [Actinoplanes sp. TBRC 11911]